MLTEARAQEVIDQTRGLLGRTWKRQLWSAWVDGRYPSVIRELAPELQQLRNSELRARKQCVPRSL